MKNHLLFSIISISFFFNWTQGQTYPKISSSTNAFGVYTEDNHPVYYDKDLNRVLFVHRKSVDWNGFPDANSGSIQGTWSDNNGQTWDSTIFWTDGINLARYPNGIIANPAGNTNPGNALIAGCGPTTSGSGWNGSWFSSGTFSPAAIQNQGEQFIPLQQPSQGALTLSQMSFPRANMCYANGSVYTLGKLYSDANTLTTFRGVALLKGTVNNGNIAWSLVDSIIPNVLVNSSGIKQIDESVRMSFSPNGQVAYIVFLGADANAQPGTPQFGYQPIVYKSIQGGISGSWQHVLGNYDWISNHSQISQFLSAYGTIRPNFTDNYGWDVTVDNQNRLNVACMIRSGVNTQSVDTVDYSYNYVFDISNPGNSLAYIYHAYTDGVNCWKLSVLDTIYSDYASSSSASAWYDSGGGSTFQNHRLQISRNTSGDKLMFSWVDDHTNISALYNPDLYIKGYSSVTGLYSPTQQKTTRGDIFYHYFSPIMMENTPTTGSLASPGIFTVSKNQTFDNNQPVEYYYINNASLDYNTQLTQGINATTGSACLFANLNVTNESCTGLANGSATVTPTGGLAPFTYVWSTNPPQTGATATGLTAGNYSVTITSANNISTTIPVSIIVQAPIVTNSSFINGCSGSPLGIVLSGSVPCSFTWTCSNNPNVTGESVGLQTSSIINNTLVNTTNSIQIVTYTVTPKALGTNCTGTPKVITVNVYPKPVMTSAAVGSICSGAPNNFTFTSSFPSSYNWVAADNVNTTGESVSLQGGNSITDAIVNNTNSPQNITYTVTPYSGFGSCQGNPQTINITVYPIPLANISPAGNTIDVCDGSTATLTASSAGSYAWYSYDPFTNTNNLISTAQSVVIPSTYSSYYVEVTSNGCSSTSNSVWVNNITTNFGTSITASPQFGATPLNTAFNNNTPNRLNYTYLWSFGDGTTSNSNAATVFHTYSSPGLFDVSLVATSLATGCSDTLTQSGYIFATGGANCTHVATINQGNSVSGCFGSSVSLTCNTNPSYSYQWNINGVAISGATTSSYSAIQSGLYSVTIIENGCPVTSAAISVNFIQAPGLPVIASNGFITPCVGGTVTLTASSSVQNGTYLWSNGVSGTTNIVTNSGTYNVTVTDPATSCSSTSGPFVVAGSSAPAPEICVATVDSLSLNNIIYWDKTNYGPMDTFVVYRDISNNNFMPIGKVSYNSLSEFVDTVRTLYSANGDPNVSSWRYKLSVIDSCGNESPMSPYHQTMFMQSTLGNFSWNHYQVEGQPAPVPALQNYFFNRDNLSNGNWNLIQTLSASSTAFTDPSYNTYQSTGSWRIETSWNISCDPTRGPINTTRSNIKGQTLLLGFDNNSLNSPFEAPKVIPNPNNGEFLIEYNLNENKIVNVEVFNVIGELITSSSIQSQKGVNKLPVNLYSDGLYLIRFTSGTQTQTLRVVVSK